MNRRRFLRAAGVVALGGLAGCGGGAADEPPAGTDGTDTGTNAKPPGTTRVDTGRSPARSGTNSTDTGADTPGTDATGTEATPTDTPEPETVAPDRVTTDYRSRERYRQPGESFAPLADLEGWRTVAGEATVSDRSYTGESSVKLVGPGGENALVEKSLPATDLSEKDLSVAIRTTTPRQIAFIVKLIDPDGNWAALELRQLSYQPPDVGWFRTCPGVYATSDLVPDLEEVDRVQIVALNGGSSDVEVWVEDMRTHPKPEKGYVVLCWDDGRQDYYEEAAPLQDERDLPGVVSMPPTIEHVGQDPFMSLDHFVERRDAGDEVVGHGTVGKTFSTVSAEELDEMLARKRRWLLANEFDGSDFVVYPGNNFDATSLDVTGRYFLMGGMNQSGDVNTTGVNGFDPLVLPRTIGHDLGIARTVVDRAAKHRNCGILNFHHFDVDNTMNRDEYAQLLDYIAETDGVEAITFSELWSMRTD